MRVVRRDHRVLRRVEQKDQIDITRIVEFAAAELTHPENDEAAVLLRLLRIGQPDRAALMGGAQQMTQRRAQGRFGEAAQRAHLLFEGPAPREFSNARDQSDAPSGEAQPPHQDGLGLVPIGLRFDGVDEIEEHGIGIVLDEAEEETPFRNGEFAKKGAVTEHGGQQPSPWLACCPDAGAVRLARVRRLGEGGFPGRKAQLAKPGIGRLWWGQLRSGQLRSGEVQ